MLGRAGAPYTGLPLLQSGVTIDAESLLGASRPPALGERSNEECSRAIGVGSGDGCARAGPPAHGCRSLSARAKTLSATVRPLAVLPTVVTLSLPGITACLPARFDPLPPIAFDTAVVWIHSGADSLRPLAQVARSSAQHEIGLSGRPALDRDSGMLFEFDGPRSTDDGFWMWGTSVPLDIAFIDAAGVIVRVLEMDPCVPPQPEESCPGYFSDVAYASALEVNGGWFARHGVAEGARVAIGARGTPGSARPVGAERLSRLIRAWPAGRGGPTTAHHGQCSARVSAPGNQIGSWHPFAMVLPEPNAIL